VKVKDAMSNHLSKPLQDLLTNNEKIVFPEKNFNTTGWQKFTGRLRYYYSLSIVAFFFLFAMPPIMLAARIKGDDDYAYPWARWGAKKWLRWSGMRIKVTGAENLEKKQSYVFISNHRSYLDTAMMFAYTGKKMGVIAKKEMLKLPIASKFMRYVNVIAIDRTNKDSAIRTMKNAAEKLRSGVSFGVFAEGTRAMPDELLPFKKGAFYMAIDTGFPIVPVAMKNTDYAMGKRQNHAFPAVCEMVFLPPIDTKNLRSEKDLADLLIKVRGVIAEELR
jgi:1-acyl-sn-glycerol-3-phosphate acyltransferase